ncbi:MAG: DNA polymerase III subunit gamma and tau [Marmoricola sp.]
METSLALYRRYRPETFAEVIGQDHVTEPLRAALAHDRVNHAYLFSGPRGCGKTTSARILARTLNCEKAPVADPCGECQSCRDLARGGPGSMDVIEIDAASHGGVDDARDLRERAFFAPVSSRYKVYIIDEAHMVSPQGFNALLKLVEEPPDHLKFIFATTEPEKVIATIRSRTHHYPFRLIAPRTLSTYLSELCEKEGVRIDPAALPLVVRAGGGSARDALSVLDQLLGGAGPQGVTYDVATGLLGYTPDTLLDEVVDAFAAADGGTVFGVVDKVIETGQDPRRFTEDVLRRLRDLVIVAAVPGASATGLIDVPEDAAERLTAQAARFGKAELVRAADLVAAGLTEMRGATAPRLLLELICARVLLPGADHGTDGLAARLDRLERRVSIGGMPAPSSGDQTRAPVPPAQVGTAKPEEVAPVVAAPAETVISTRLPSNLLDPGVEQQAPPSVSKPGAGERGLEMAPEEVAQQPSPRAGTRAPSPTNESTAQAPASTGEKHDDGPGAPGSTLGLADVRRIWPDLLDRVKSMRRFTWILLSQNAQITAVEASTLTLGFKNAGSRDSFISGGSDEILRQALIDLIGADWKVDAIIDPSAEPGAQLPLLVTKSAVDPAEGSAPDGPPAWAAGESEPRQAPDAETIAKARENIQPTRTGPAPAEPKDDPDAAADRDDPDAEDDGLRGAELLRRELGATVIEEIPHE